MAGLGSFFDALAPAVIWKTLWPVLVGVGLFIGLRRWLHRLPKIPSGDIVALGGGLSRAVVACGAAILKLESVFRLWPAACLTLLLIVVLLTAPMLGGR